MTNPPPFPPASTIIAIDGHAASGKGTLARRIAEHYNFAYLDSGKLYRLVAYHLLADDTPLTVQNATACALEFTAAIPFDLMNDARLRHDDVSQAAMEIAAFAETREALKAVQQDFAAHPYSDKQAAAGAVIDGRDIGTVICPTAQVKLFVTADVKVRAERRVHDLQDAVPYDRVLADLQKRDAADENRSVAPLRRADDAVLIDTSKASVEESLRQCLKIIDEKLSR